MIKIKGKVKYAGPKGFYAIEVHPGEYVIIETLGDELAGDDVISWNDYEEFYNHTQDCKISAMVQSDVIGLQAVIKNLQTW